MHSGAARFLGVSLIAATLWSVGIAQAEAGFVGTATITGKVTNASGQIITGAKVLVQVTASSSSNVPAPYPTGFWGPRRLVATNNQGLYSATVDIPDGVAADKLYAWLVVVKPPTAGMQYYRTTRLLVSLNPLPSPGGAQQYVANVVMSALSGARSVGVYVSGTIRDAQSGARLRGATVSFAGTREVFVTDGDGAYFGIVPISGSAETVSYSITAEPTSIPGGLLAAVNDGINYTAVSGQITLTAGQSLTKDAELSRGATNTTVTGRLTDGPTGAPVRHELVYLYASTTPMGSGVYWGNYAVTDEFGRYALRVPFTSVSGTPLYLTLSTGFGSFGSVAYARQDIDITSRVRMGEVYQHSDLALVPATNPDALNFAYQGPSPSSSINVIDIVRTRNLVDISDTGATPSSHLTEVFKVDFINGYITRAAFNQQPTTWTPGLGEYRIVLNRLIGLALYAQHNVSNTAAMQRSLDLVVAELLRL